MCAFSRVSTSTVRLLRGQTLVTPRVCVADGDRAGDGGRGSGDVWSGGRRLGSFCSVGRAFLSSLGGSRTPASAVILHRLSPVFPPSARSAWLANADKNGAGLAKEHTALAPCFLPALPQAPLPLLVCLPPTAIATGPSIFQSIYSAITTHSVFAPMRNTPHICSFFALCTVF